MGIGGGSSCGGVKSEKKCKQKAVKKCKQTYIFSGKEIINKPLELILLNWLKVGAKYSSSGRLPDLFLAALGVKYPSESVKNVNKLSKSKQIM